MTDRCWGRKEMSGMKRSGERRKEKQCEDGRRRTSERLKGEGDRYGPH